MGKYAVHRKDTTQNPLVDWLEQRGCVYQHVGEPIDGFLAVPRREVIRMSQIRRLEQMRGFLVVAVEWKTGNGKLRPSQEKFFETWPGPKYVIRTQLEAAAMLAEVQGGR